MRAFVTGGSGFVGKALIEALCEQGHQVRALARADGARRAVSEAGAEPVPGALEDGAALRDGVAGCRWVFHAAALVKDWGPRDEFQRVNVEGTRRVLDACRAAGVRRLVHVSTEAVLLGRGPLVRVDETLSRAGRPAGLYSWSKAESEALVMAANGPGLETVVVRPRLVWGRGDTTFPRVVAAVRSGAFRWIGGGRYLTSTCHVRNACEGLILAAERGRPGEIYFVTDGEPVEFRRFTSDMLRAHGVEPPDGSMPRWLVGAAAAAMEVTFRGLRLAGQPLITRQALALMSHEVTVSDAKARRELGYVGRVTREAGLAELSAGAR